ncbi:MAG: serine/threonine protein kinase [Myxococcales bacterium]|nr:serine/threonine protein kinase [Myxococcales bacterium]MCB9670707.1 serine/threonine protein kinase [Alphaproteobacteria bacterium]
MAGETWVESADGVADPSMTGAFVRGRRPLGRSTVLPRLDDEAGGTALVHPSEARYAQDTELGKGGLGVVMGARDRDIGRRVAIKQLRPEIKSQKALLRFAEEVRTVGMLDHPNIIPIHDVGADETGAPYFVMKYVEGRTLRDVLDDLRAGDPEAHAHWTFARRMDVFKKVLDAVGFAHGRGVVHRDLKPENIMVGEHGEVHVLDWGIAHRAQMPDPSGLKGADPLGERLTQTRDGAILGTPAYMSPEQASGKPAGPASDIYSLGVVLHEWLTLTHYLSDLEDLEALLEGVRTRDPVPPNQIETGLQSRVPPELSWLVRGALAKDPEGRYASVEAWLDRIEGVEAGDIPIQCAVTFQKHWLARLGQLIDRYPTQWMLGAAAMLAGAGFFVTGLVGIAFALGALLL